MSVSSREAREYRDALKKWGVNTSGKSSKTLRSMYNDAVRIRESGKSVKRMSQRELDKASSKIYSQMKREAAQTKTQQHMDVEYVKINIANKNTGLVYLRGDKRDDGTREVRKVSADKYARLYKERDYDDMRLLTKQEYEEYLISNQQAWEKYRYREKETQAKEKQISKVQAQLKASGFEGSREQALKTKIVSSATMKTLKATGGKPSAVEELAARANIMIGWENKQIEKENELIRIQQKQQAENILKEKNTAIIKQINETNARIAKTKKAVETKKATEIKLNMYVPRKLSSSETMVVSMDYAAEQKEKEKAVAIKSLMSTTIPKETPPIEKYVPMTQMEKVGVKEKAKSISWTNPIEKLRAYTTGVKTLSTDREETLKQQINYNKIDNDIIKGYTLSKSTESISPVEYKTKIDTYTTKEPTSIKTKAAVAIGVTGLIYTKGVKGVYNVADSILHPVQTVKGTASAIVHPIKTTKSVASTLIKDPLSVVEFGTEAWLTGKITTGIGSTAIKTAKKLSPVKLSTKYSSSSGDFLKSEGYVVEQVSKLDRYGNVYEGFDIKKTYGKGQKTLDGKTSLKETYTTVGGKSTFPDTYKGVSKAYKVEVSSETASGLKLVAGEARPMYSKKLGTYQTGWEVEGLYFDVTKKRFVDINKRGAQQTLGKGREFKTLDVKTGEYKTIYDKDIFTDMGQVFVKDGKKATWAKDYKGWTEINKNLKMENLQRKYGTVEIIDNRVKQKQLGREILGEKKITKQSKGFFKDKFFEKKIKSEKLKQLEKVDDGYQKQKLFQESKIKYDKMELMRGSIEVKPKIKKYTTKKLSRVISKSPKTKVRTFKLGSKTKTFLVGVPLSASTPKNLKTNQKLKSMLDIKSKTFQTSQPKVKQKQEVMSEYKFDTVQERKTQQLFKLTNEVKTYQEVQVVPKIKQKTITRPIVVPVIPNIVPVIPITSIGSRGRPLVVKTPPGIPISTFKFDEDFKSKKGKQKNTFIKEWTISNKLWMPQVRKKIVGAL